MRTPRLLDVLITLSDSRIAANSNPSHKAVAPRSYPHAEF
jgi:hypothetical protein